MRNPVRLGDGLPLRGGSVRHPVGSWVRMRRRLPRWRLMHWPLRRLGLGRHLRSSHNCWNVDERSSVPSQRDNLDLNTHAARSCAGRSGYWHTDTSKSTAAGCACMHRAPSRLSRSLGWSVSPGRGCRHVAPCSKCYIALSPDPRSICKGGLPVVQGWVQERARLSPQSARSQGLAVAPAQPRPCLDPMQVMAQPAAGAPVRRLELLQGRALGLVPTGARDSAQARGSPAGEWDRRRCQTSRWRCRERIANTMVDSGHSRWPRWGTSRIGHRRRTRSDRRLPSRKCGAN